MTHAELAFAVVVAIVACGAIFWLGLALYLMGAHDPQAPSHAVAGRENTEVLRRHPHGYCTWKDGSESCRCDSHTPVAFVVTRKETK